VADSNYENLDSIIRGCIQKEEKAQEELYKKYFGYALSVALLYINNRNDAIETVNDSFIKIFKEIKRFDLSRSFKAWLRRIVINTSLDRIRKSNKWMALDQAEAVSLEDSSPNVLSRLQAQEIELLFNYLPHILKTVFCLYEIEGYSHKEIAKRLKIAKSSSRVYLTRAKKLLRELYVQNNNIIAP